MTLNIPAFVRDRREAASDEFRSQETRRSQRARRAARRAGEQEPRAQYNPLYRASSAAHRGGAARARGYDRTLAQIRAVVLHQTLGSSFQRPRQQRRMIGSDSRIDRIAAHFLVMQDGSVFYTHDLRYLIYSAGGVNGFDIEFCGRWDYGETPSGTRLDPMAIKAARRLIKWLKSELPRLDFIHPHGQVETPNARGERRKLEECPGPDIWVNVGEWCVNNLRLSATVNRSLYPHAIEIDAAQTNPRWDQSVR